MNLDSGDPGYFNFFLISQCPYCPHVHNKCGLGEGLPINEQ